MADTATTAAEVALWLEAFIAASAQLKDNTAEAIRQAWLSFDGWYNAALVAALAKEMSDLSIAAQQTTAGLSTQYLAGVAAAMGVPGVPLPAASFQVIRAGAPLALVHTRPAEAYKRAIATGQTTDQAMVKAAIRAGGLALTDMSLQDRQAMSAALESAGITQYRRIIRPELSKTGTCGLCIAAATKLYDTGVLMPIHPPSCKCIVMPVVGDQDPGLVLNAQDLKAVLGQLYEDSDSTSRSALSQTKYQVNTHGEFGPVLTRAQDAFRGPDQVGLEDDLPRVARLLEKTVPVLDQMESEGEPVEGALAYQRDLVARLRGIAA